MKVIFITLFTFFAITCSAQKFTDLNGHLKVSGNQLTNERGIPVQLKGFNTYNLTYCPECVTRDAVRSNSEFWGANVIRATVYVDDYWNDQSYNLNPELSKRMVDSVVSWSEEFGLYCIIDWHILKIGNPNAPEHAGADDFFREMSAKHADKKHVLYEICNEPNGDEVPWDTIASYAASHLELLGMLSEQIHRIPVFASEWGVCEYTGNGDVNFGNSEKFLDVMEGHVLDNDTVSVSWCLFSYSDVKEAASALKPGSCGRGEWENMTPTGFFIRDFLQQSN